MLSIPADSLCEYGFHLDDKFEIIDCINEIFIDNCIIISCNFDFQQR